MESLKLSLENLDKAFPDDFTQEQPCGVVSDSTRVLGDGNCTPPDGLGVMEGKAFLMKYLCGMTTPRGQHVLSWRS